ncbi:MAG: 16S rRNA (cytidine(1402)-2'-O)-methyltransferase [Pseudomonadota bacterium]
MGERTFVIDGVVIEAAAALPGLHVVATPIGNLGDITLRALKTLAGVDRVAVEDTRHSGRLLSHFGIKVPLLRYDEHSAASQRPKIVSVLEGGGSVALISDAGTPLISDPGFRLLVEVRAAGHAVHAVPGPSAVVAALSVAGLPTDAFFFAGFLPQKSQARQRRIKMLKDTPATLCFYEAPHRLSAALDDLCAELGPRDAVVARELTKRFETVDRDPLDRLAARYRNEAVKGEIVILVAPAEASVADEAQATALLEEALTRMPASAAAQDVAQRTGLNRRDLYRMAIALKAPTS